MHYIISSDDYTPLIEVAKKILDEQGHTFEYIGPDKNGCQLDWTSVAAKAMQYIQNGHAHEAIAFCWTGTGVSIVCNKFKKIRAALCVDAETAKGARIYNHANVLNISYRLTSEHLFKEILSAWLSTPFSKDSWNLSQVEAINHLENNYLLSSEQS